jgi:hypothetical protein
MATRPPGVPVTLLFFWGIMGAALACCLLWVSLGVGGRWTETVWAVSSWLLSKLGISLDPITGRALLHLQFVGFGFVAGILFRLVGMWKQNRAWRDEDQAGIE